MAYDPELPWCFSHKLVFAGEHCSEVRAFIWLSSLRQRRNQWPDAMAQIEEFLQDRGKSEKFIRCQCERARVRLEPWLEVVGPSKAMPPWGINRLMKVVLQALCACLPLAAHAESSCVFVPRPCPPVGNYNEQIAHLRMQGVAEADIKALTDQAWKVIQDVPGTGVTDALANAVRLSGNGCDEAPARVIGKIVPYPIATAADLRRYPRCP